MKTISRNLDPSFSVEPSTYDIDPTALFPVITFLFMASFVNTMLKTDAVRFFRAWMQAPLRVASLAASSPALAELITAEISASSGPVVELGPGTGVFTKALLERGVPEHKLVLVEMDAMFARLLEVRYPLATLVKTDASQTPWSAGADSELPGAVVSGLPLLSMPVPSVNAILSHAFEILREEGAFYQFTYGPVCPVSRKILTPLGLQATRLGGTFANLPPASVYRIQRRAVNGFTGLEKQLVLNQIKRDGAKVN